MGTAEVFALWAAENRPRRYDEPMERVAILTSGGDSPGMNTAIWAAIKLAAVKGTEVVGVEGGYEGLVEGRFRPLTKRSQEGSGLRPVAGLAWTAGTGGTFLGSSRSIRFLEQEHRATAATNLRQAHIRGLIVIGGNGSLTGAHSLAVEHPDLRIIGIPASIDNDIGGTMDALGVDSALNTIIDACDRISDTARSHHRAFILEVMGRHSGYLAMAAAVAAVADAVILPEETKTEEEIRGALEKLIRTSFSPESDKRRVLIIKAEGVSVPTTRLARDLQEQLSDMPDISVRATVLGHLVRGGHPSYHDRMLAGRLALAAMTALHEGHTDLMTGWKNPDGIATADANVKLVGLAEMITETAAMLDGSSPVVQRRVKLLNKVQEVLAL
jgi:6-phosphofructokinase 1